MRLKLILILGLLFNFTASFAGESSNEYFDILTKKTIEDFHKGIELYNNTKSADAPPIKRHRSQSYRFSVKTTEVRFSLVNYLNNEMYVNDRLVEIKKFGLSRSTVWTDAFISAAVAEDGDVDGETTKVILTALGKFSKNLEDVGMMCFLGCVKDTKNNNLKKVLATLDNQKDNCNEQLYEQSDSIKKFPSHGMISVLHSTLSPEFQSVRNLIQKISESNQKTVNSFMKDKLLVEKNYKDCIGVMTSGTAADSSYDQMSKGMAVLASGGVASMAIENAVSSAKNICIKIDELKSCLLDVKQNLAVINSIKRASKSTSVDAQQESLPNMNSIAK